MKSQGFSKKILFQLFNKFNPISSSISAFDGFFNDSEMDSGIESSQTISTTNCDDMKWIQPKHLKNLPKKPIQTLWEPFSTPEK